MAAGVRVDHAHDALKVGVALLVVAYVVAERDETRAELLGLEAARVSLVEVVEGHAELVHLLLGDALGVAREYLILDLVDVARDRDAELLPADAYRLHGVAGVAVLEYHGLLDLLVDVLELVDVRLVGAERLLHAAQLGQLLLKRLHAHGAQRELIVLLLDPRTALVGRVGEEHAQLVVLLLLARLLEQRLVALRHQPLHLVPLALELARLDARVRVVGELQAVLLTQALRLVGERVDGRELLVGLGQRGLELLVGVDQALDLVHAVHDEHVDEVLARALQPVVVRRRALRILQEQAVHVLQNTFGFLFVVFMFISINFAY